MRPVVGLLVLAMLLFGLGLAEGWGLLHTLSYAVFLTVGLSYVWAWASIRGIYVRPRPPIYRSEVGSYLEERAELENLSWLPRPWLELIDGSDHPTHNLSQVLSLGPGERRIRPVRTLCEQRGQFRLGPLWLASGDPFGLFRRERQITGPTSLIVFPATVELAPHGRLPGDLPGGSLQGERVHFTTPNVATIREYQPGDSFSRVHWRSTARLGRLMVKEFERDPFSDLWLIIDLDRLVQAGGGPESTVEYAVTVTASLGKHFLLRDRAVGVISQGQRLPCDRGPRQLMRLLEFLAVARPRSQLSLDELLLAEGQRFGRRDDLIIVSPAPPGLWVSVCRDLVARGVHCSVVSLDAASFGAGARQGRTLPAITALGLPAYELRLGDDLAVALARPVAGRP